MNFVKAALSKQITKLQKIRFLRFMVLYVIDEAIKNLLLLFIVF